MTQPHYHTLRPWVALRDFADASGSRSGASGRVCARCGAHLRRGNTSYNALCAPCDATRTIPTLLPPAWRPAGRTCPACGGLKAYGAVRCLACYKAGPKHNQQEAR